MGRTILVDGVEYEVAWSGDMEAAGECPTLSPERPRMIGKTGGSSLMQPDIGHAVFGGRSFYNTKIASDQE